MSTTHATNTRSRRPAGVPTGGQFAPEVHAEPEVSLPAPLATHVVASQPTGRSLGRCEACHRPVSVMNDAVVGGRGQCPDCGQMVPVEAIHGVVTAAVCDARCEGATGKKCECSCGGRNHGGAWTQTSEMLESELAAFREAELAKVERQEARRSAERQSIADRRAAFADEYEELLRWMENSESSFAHSLLTQLNERGTLTERQIEAAMKAEEQESMRSAEAAAEPPAAPIPGTGTLDIPVTILGVKQREGWEGRMETKMLVAWDHDGGRSKLWMTMPAALRHDRWGRGDRVTVRGEVSASPSDPTFGFMRRPRVVSAPEPVKIDPLLPSTPEELGDPDDDIDDDAF